MVTLNAYARACVCAVMSWRRSLTVEPPSPFGRCVAVRCGQFKYHFATHTGFGKEPFVAHDPPLIFNIDVDYSERMPLLPRNGSTHVKPGEILPTEADIEAAKAAVVAHMKTLPVPAVRAELDLLDRKAMDCEGLTANQSGCCLQDGGRCAAG
jgi:hypothetical protein